MFSPKSVPILMQLSIIVPTPSIYRKKAIRNNNTFLFDTKIFLTVEKICLNTDAMELRFVST